MNEKKPFDEWAIGSADSFEIITVSGVLTVEYDLAQIQSEGTIKYEVWDEAYGSGSHDSGRLIEKHETEEIQLGSDIHVELVDSLRLTMDMEVKGMIVPKMYIGKFIDEYGSLMNIYPMQKEPPKVGREL